MVIPNDYDMANLIGKIFRGKCGNWFEVIGLNHETNGIEKLYLCQFEDGSITLGTQYEIENELIGNTTAGCKKKFEYKDYEYVTEVLFKDHTVLAIPDLHIPFEHKDALEFCKKMYYQYKCNRVVFLGDVFDFNSISYHEKDPEAMSPMGEYNETLSRVKEWHEAFPNAKVIFGNHGSLPLRKMFSACLPIDWIKAFNELMETPTWTYGDHFEIDGVSYVHGNSGVARTRMLNFGTSVVQGHYHSKSSVEYWVGSDNDLKFAVQLGALIDKEAYAFRYAKFSMPNHMNVAIIKGGKKVIVEYMGVE